MATFGHTWWGEQWLSAFNGIDDTNRLPRGRRYAANGSVLRIEIQGNRIDARIRGSRRTPYKVAISLAAFSAEQCQQLLAAVSDDPAILSRLLSRQLPHPVLDIARSLDIQLFPRRWHDMRANCSCPDWAMPCKHIAAVIYLIANEIDKNPFLVFTLHGLDLAKALEAQAGGRLETLEALPSVLQSWADAPAIQGWQPSGYEAFDAIDLTAIPPLQDKILTLLPAKPLFYPKDFRATLASQYKRTARAAARFDAEPTQPWMGADQVPDLTFVIDENGHLLHTLVSNESYSSPEATLDTWLQRLRDVPPGLEPYLSEPLLLWRLLLRVALKLTAQCAYVPAVLNNSTGETLIHWRAATHSEPVQALMSALHALCPPDLVLLQDRPKQRRKALLLHADAPTQIQAALQLLLGHFIARGYGAAAPSAACAPIEQLFFAAQPQRFERFENAETPGVIRHWLSRLSLGARPHRLYLQVEERPLDRLSVDIRIEQGKQLQRLDALLAAPGLSRIQQMQVLADLAVLADYLPQVEQLYRSADRIAELDFSLEAFTPVFRQTLPALRMLGIQVILPKALRDLAQPRLSLSVSDSGSEAAVSYLNLDQLLQFDWQIAIGDQRVSISEFRQLLHSSSGIVRLLDQYVMVDDSQLQQLMSRLDALPESLSRFELLKAGLAGELDETQVDLGGGAKALFDQLLRQEPAPLPAGLNATLRPYQLRGYEWLVQNGRSGFGALLADDMGLGKTLQVIAALLHLKESGQLEHGKALVVAPTSLLTNWSHEIARFAPGLRVQTYHGASRNLALAEHDVILTSYGLVRTDSKQLGKPNWRALVIDEAQNIKNPGSAQTKAIKKLRADIRIGMSGTPVENRLMEYWSLFDFTNRGYLGSQKQFRTEFANPIEQDRDQDRLERFRKITGPFILRRLKSDRQIISDLPDKIESNRYCTLSTEQAALYQSTVDTVMADLQASDGIERRGIVFKLLNALKQICNSPAQFLNQGQALVEDSGKLAAFMEIMTELDGCGEKALIFTQYTGMGDLLVDSLRRQFGWEVPFLHGGLSRKQRDEMVDRFQNERGVRAMILSLKAGGTGLNLTAASQVIHYDLWWNPAVEAQATDRAYRIGQQRAVLVHRLITENTFEEKIDAMIQSKKELADLSVASGEQWITELSDTQLRDLIALGTPAPGD
ncbi:DEAD/DEAH box helicase [Marinobacterium rhizophilum]|uniref:DEAD/DEAH box helicase n=1 Tax=Marinobacterium rhizophilum TaxID=420402 RepID=A0ABY5HIW0_9GAMM|nr:DEAD/DEAH box helicase [Marinobacterium rhizophilum]UTW12039.1 DEAD/DEAH box helicase [Marinobacterium rhizophilum]